MKKFALILFCGLIALSFSKDSFSEDLKKDKNIKTARILERISFRHTAIEQFGDAVNRDALRVAAKQFREGNIKNNTAKFDVTVTVTELPSKHPDLPDACFETCLDYGQSTALNCYINCNAPKP